jgi:hypothetical protein
MSGHITWEKERKKKKNCNFLSLRRSMADAHPYEVPRAIVARLVKEAVRVPVPHTCHNETNTTDFKKSGLGGALFSSTTTVNPE